MFFIYFKTTFKFLIYVIYENISKDTGKFHNHKAQSSRGTKGRTDVEQIRIKQKSDMKSHKQKRTATEEWPWNY